MKTPPALHGIGRPTLEDVAAVAGVSRATVSRVINDSPRVSPEARESVQEAVRQLGYVPNKAARTLVTRRTEAIALVLSEKENKVFDDPHFATVVRTATEELSTMDTQMVLMLTQDETTHARVLRFLGGGHVDGALLLAPHKRDPLPEAVANLPIPVVFGGKLWLPEDGLHLVDNDNVGGARMATEHLLGLGRRTVVTITGPSDEKAALDRLAGWQQAMSADQDRVARLSACGEFTRQGGEQAMRELLARVPELDGVFAANDLMADGALRVLRAAGRRVPEEIAVIGFDDQPAVAPLADPPLTTIRQHPGEQMRRMVQILLRLVAGEDVPPGREILPTELIRRASA
ncbi:LacI family DNA-binding transcriptional regulator [Crossiella cryophila]|uniref:DNA-binding LacI/PurR family transcriptional regulator n=1 Tax=Crossiella cryophila TaxID=43355 RepID=A0A7W7C479_9PSEU|nr:LacI family DNA-binding transcriptional regulator [Crossiella cryophila]MBB4674246.1 DNA-binding LacI/PurR family transcriptional regulator [Crossiella cryophila]